MKYVLTHTKSIYQIDTDNKSVCRLNGVKAATLRQGQDGSWKQFESISTPQEERSLTIVWEIVDVEGEMIARTTITSNVVKVADKLDELVAVN